MFGENQANIKAVITAEDKASSVLKGFGKSVDDQSSKLSQFGGVAKFALATVGVGSVVAFGKQVISAFSESQDLIAQTNAVLKSTGGIAGITADQVTNLATAWEHQTKFSDEAVRNAENILLTFTGISKDIFPQTTQAVLDISTALHEDLQSASIQVGKALQDPVLGVTALRRVGVNFNDAQRNVIKNLVDTGQKAKAQAIILKELKTEFGGSAKAAGDTFSGSIAKLKNRFDDLEETLGGKFVSIMTSLGNFYAQHRRLINDVAVAVGTLGAAIGIVVGVFAIWRGAIAAVRTAQLALNLVMETNPIILIITAIIAVVIALMTHWKQVKQVAADVWHSVSSFFTNLWHDVTRIFGNIGRAIKSAFMLEVKVITAPYRAIFNGIATLWNNTVGKLHWSIPHWVPKIGGHTLGVPHIPLLATGGIVTKPTLAMVGEAGPEAVVPLNKSNAMGNTTINITVQAGAFMGSQQDARKYAQQIASALKDVASSKNQTLPQLLGVKI